jgi:hypothetical protein
MDDAKPDADEGLAGRERAVTYTVAPRRPKARATPRPMPRLAPVTTATMSPCLVMPNPFPFLWPLSLESDDDLSELLVGFEIAVGRNEGEFRVCSSGCHETPLLAGLAPGCRPWL